MQSGQIIFELEGKKKRHAEKNNPPNPERL